MPWLRLDEATTLLDHDVEKARVALERGISKSWLVRPSGDPNRLMIQTCLYASELCPRQGGALRGEPG